LSKSKQVDLDDVFIAQMMAAGHELVAGVDEVGRGCLAGPVTVAAVVLPPGFRLPGLTDSKLLAGKQRHQLAVEIKRAATCIGIGWSSPIEIDNQGLTWAVRQAAIRALEGLAGDCRAVLLDGRHNYLDGYCHVRTLVKADSRVLSVAAASVVAKVARDNYMRRQHRLYPGYGFNLNVGYGTPKHLQALKNGLTPLHRRRFRPVALAEVLS
jgi:ribonuclease HII